MFPPVETSDPKAVQAEVQAVYLRLFAEADPHYVPHLFQWAVDCFMGTFRDYQAVDAKYHDLEHTLQGTLCLARLLRGRHLAGAAPVLTERMFQLSIAAILLHDTGYLKKQDDREGTGAKYTITHVARSADFAEELLREKGFNHPEIQTVRNMICCTGVDTHLDSIPFQSELERVCGCALATADLLGQMAAHDYVEKLPVLYAEFAEAAAHSPEGHPFITSFNSAEDLVSRTPGFWETGVLPKLNGDFQGLYRFLSQPYPDGPNEYLKRIEANMNRLRSGPAVANV